MRAENALNWSGQFSRILILGSNCDFGEFINFETFDLDGIGWYRDSPKALRLLSGMPGKDLFSWKNTHPWVISTISN